MLIADFYTILNFYASANHIKAILLLNKQHEIYKGHFPGQPVVPGVVQLQIIKELVEKSLNCELFLSEVVSAKYLNMIDPKVNEKQSFNIKLTQTEDGHLKFNATITAGELVFTKLIGTFIAK